MLSSVMQSLCPFCLSGEVVAKCGCRYAETARRHTIVVARGWFLADGGQYPKRPASSRVVYPALPPERPLYADQPGYEAPVTRDAPVKVSQPTKPKPRKAKPPVPAALPDGSPLTGAFAPLGECRWCDHRRQSNAAYVARHRAKTAPKDGSKNG